MCKLVRIAACLTLEGQGESGVEKVTRVVIGHDRVAGEKDAVAQGDRQIAGQLPVGEQVRFPPQKRAVGGRFVDGRFAVQLVEDEQVRADRCKPLELRGRSCPECAWGR